MNRLSPESRRNTYRKCIAQLSPESIRIDGKSPPTAEKQLGGYCLTTSRLTEVGLEGARDTNGRVDLSSRRHFHHQNRVEFLASIKCNISKCEFFHKRTLIIAWIWVPCLDKALDKPPQSAYSLSLSPSPGTHAFHYTHFGMVCLRR